MAFIEKQDQTPRVEAKIKLRQDTLELVDRYAKWLGGSDRDYTVEQILLKVIRGEKEFLAAQLPDTISDIRPAKQKKVAA